jgi:alpha-glucosidase/alpha-D-xyloside xylohydrolase
MRITNRHEFTRIVTNSIRLALAAFAVLLSVCVRAADGAAIRIAEATFELSVSQVSDRTVRIDLSPLDEQRTPRPDPKSDVFVPFQVIEKLRIRELSAAKGVQVGQFHLAIKPAPLTLTLTRADGKLVQECIVDPKDGSILFHTDAPVLGLGEGRQQFDRRGYFYNFINGQTTFLATHGATMPVPFLIGTDGWSMFIHNPPPAPKDPREANQPWGQFDLRGDHAGPPPDRNTPVAAQLTPPDPLPTRGRFIPRQQTLGQAPIHLYLSSLDQPADAIAEFVRLFGHPVMPPKWALGYIQSHRSLASPAEPIEIAKTFRKKQIPCDALIYLGSGYTNDQAGQSGWNTGHGSLAFNPRIFDKPQEMIEELHAMNFKIILHVNAAPPGLYGDSINNRSDDPLHISNYWAKHVPLVKMGIDGWWPDDGDNLPIEARLARQKLYHEGSLRDRPNERPWSLNRNGYAGTARYGAWVWSGDVQSRWQTLANHIATGLNFSLSVSPFWGTDTGGFFLPTTKEYTGELYTRWFQFSAFTPLFRSHGRSWHLHLPWGWNLGETGPREMGNNDLYPPDSELHNAQVEPICKSFVELRYRLMPYNYTLVREACDTGMPLMRAMWLHYPMDAQALKLADEYLWGRDLLIAPVVEKGASSRRVYLPMGDWFDWWTGEKVAGAKWIDRKVDLATMPIYVRAGAIIPLDPVRQYTAQQVDEPTAIRIYPGANGAFTLYDDDGHTLAYQSGRDAVWIKFHWDDANRRLIIERDERMKQWSGGSRAFSVKAVDRQGEQKRVEFRGERIEVAIQ